MIKDKHKKMSLEKQATMNYLTFTPPKTTTAPQRLVAVHLGSAIWHSF
jgi:hypothetical protein